jgi:hypothetical protein
MPGPEGIDPQQPIPEEFAEMFAALLQPGDEEAVAAVLERALRLPDEKLAQFMAAAAALVRSSPHQLKAADLGDLVPPD